MEKFQIEREQLRGLQEMPTGIERDMTALNVKNAIEETRLEHSGISIEKTAIMIRLGMGEDTQFLIKELQKLI
jgi:hypothetical protein